MMSEEPQEQANVHTYAADSIALLQQIAAATLTYGTTHEQTTLAQLACTHADAREEAEGLTGESVQRRLSAARQQQEAWAAQVEWLQAELGKMLAGEG